MRRAWYFGEDQTVAVAVTPAEVARAAVAATLACLTATLTPRPGAVAFVAVPPRAGTKPLEMEGQDGAGMGSSWRAITASGALIPQPRVAGTAQQD